MTEGSEFLQIDNAIAIKGYSQCKRGQGHHSQCKRDHRRHLQSNIDHGYHSQYNWDQGGNSQWIKDGERGWNSKCNGVKETIFSVIKIEDAILNATGIDEGHSQWDMMQI